jgi:sulfur-oxidizing protein SoxY
MMHKKLIARRHLLRGAASAAAALAIVQKAAFATPETAKKALEALIKGEPKDGRIVIKAPEIAENGNSVPVTVSVESPMTDSDYVKAIHVVADGNPNPNVISISFTPASGKAQADFRVRMAQTQKIIAVAETSDGKLFMASREVKVTIGGCGG